MTEGAIAFGSTQTERSRLAKQAKYKKNGVGVAKLGNKPITNKEIAAKHGPCFKYEFNRFLTFSEFKNMPKDLQVEYINKLEDKYDIGIKHISIILFNIGEEGLRSHLRINNILKDCNPDKKRGKTGEEQFRADITEQKRRLKLGEEIQPVFSEEPAAKEAVPENKIPMFMDYESFKKLPEQDKIEFCNRILKEYPGAGLSTISSVCFEKSHGALSYHMKAHGMLDKVNKPTSGSNSAESTESLERFERDVKHWKNFGTLIFEPNKVEANIPVAEVKMPKVCFEEQKPLESKKAVEKKAPKEEKKEATQETVKHEEEKPMAEQAVIDSSNFAVIETPVLSAFKAHDEERIGMSFHSDYISENGLKEEEFDALKMLFKDKKVRVNIDISAW